MGGCDFFTDDFGKTAKDAFRAATEQARYDYGHAGYTGTIAEKSEFVMVPLPEGREPYEYAEELMDNPPLSAPYGDKWGPCGCIKFPDKDKYLFFGVASS